MIVVFKNKDQLVDSVLQLNYSSGVGIKLCSRQCGGLVEKVVVDFNFLSSFDYKVKGDLYLNDCAIFK